MKEARMKLKQLEKLYLKAVRQGLSLDNVPYDRRTATVCMAAVRHNKGALGYVPEALKTKALCKAAVKHDGQSLEYVPEEFRDYKMCEVAMLQSRGLAIKFFPEEWEA
jgi:hypothetical protein